MSLPRVELDPETGYGYIYLADAGVDDVKTSVPLHAADGEPAALDSLVLDFDRDGRLLGIEVLGSTEVLRPELLGDFER